MELFDRCLHLCGHIQTLTGVHTALLNVREKCFSTTPFRGNCQMAGNGCSAYHTHLYGAYEAERWDGKYIYYCPCGLTFVAAVPLFNNSPMEYCLVVGPIVMSNDNDPDDDITLEQDVLSALPRMTTAQVRALSEVLSSALSSSDLLPPDVDSGSQASFLQMMYDLTTDTPSKLYPIEHERQFQEYIRTGNKAAAQELLNTLLAHIYLRAGTDLAQIKSRVQELLVLMSRAAIDGGADVDEILNLCQRYASEVDNLTGSEALNRWIGAILHKFISFAFDFNNIKHQNVIFKTNAYIKEHLAEKISLDQAAEQVYLSKSYFCRIIKDELGCTFTEYVNRIRVERSKTLLRSSGMSIAEIACAVGFDDQSYYTRIFKKQVGVAPGKFREQAVQKH